MSFVLKVSDSAVVPNRGHLLRLKVAEGAPQVKHLKPGTRLRVTGPRGQSGVVDVLGLPAMAGRQTQARLEHTREFDVVIPAAQALIDGARIDIGWTLAPANGET